MSSPPWQDRRFMFPVGKQVHEPARRSSFNSTGEGGVSRKLSFTSPGGLATLNSNNNNNPATSGDGSTAAAAAVGGGGSGGVPNVASKNIFLTGKEVHEGVGSSRRRSSGSNGRNGGENGATAAVKQPAVVAAAPLPPLLPTAARRRSSASSQGSASGGLFSSLMASRSSEDTNTLRESWKDASRPSGVFGSLFGPGSK